MSTSIVSVGKIISDLIDAKIKTCKTLDDKRFHLVLEDQEKNNYLELKTKNLANELIELVDKELEIKDFIFNMIGIIYENKNLRLTLNNVSENGDKNCNNFYIARDGVTTIKTVLDDELFITLIRKFENYEPDLTRYGENENTFHFIGDVISPIVIVSKKTYPTSRINIDLAGGKEFFVKKLFYSLSDKIIEYIINADGDISFLREVLES